jgi:predicted AlkP superfamily phosphohydrolase/phosphomutase
MTRAFVVGLDGASWRLLNPWLEKGYLPNLAAIIEEGTSATHQSCLPPVTFPNWKCYSSGKDPGRFGVYWFERIDIERGTVEVMDGQNFETAELWDYLNDADLQTGVVNMPTMYPPREIDGVVVCGGPDAVEGEYRSLNSGYTYPATLESELTERYGYRVHPDPLLSSDQERGAEVDEIHELLNLRFQVAYDLFEERDLDFCHVTLFYLNVLQHFFWDDEPTREAWSIVDEWLGRLHELEGTNIFVMSDHGSAPTTTEFYINEWLSENGYLEKKPVIDDYLRSVGLTRQRALTAAKRLGIVNHLDRLVPERIQKVVPMESGAKRERKLEKVNIPASEAVASGQGPVYLNPAHDTKSVREELIIDLKTVTDDTGNPLFIDIHRSEDVYSGTHANAGPQVVIEMCDGVHINDGLGGGEVQTKPDRWAAENTREGIFAAAGPDIAPVGELDTISIMDIAPTILATYDLAVPTDVVGEFLPVFEDKRTVGTRNPLPSTQTGAIGTNQEVADRLKQLGYME